MFMCVCVGVGVGVCVCVYACVRFVCLYFHKHILCSHIMYAPAYEVVGPVCRVP